MMLIKSSSNNRNRLLLIALMVLVSACSTVPREIRDAPESSPSLAAVQQNPKAVQTATVRWGGSIVRATNKQDHTLIEIVSRPLLNNARPSDADKTEGRFIARVDGFLDPQIYAPGRMITVVGAMDAVETGSIGEHAYAFPVIQVSGHYLWEKVVRRDYPHYYHLSPWEYRYYRRYYHPYYPPYWPYYRSSQKEQKKP
ncbi:MAG TPA: hypothetical protein DD979_05480 [Gammaproteobacteria bacterium]|nr:hypothetical protein [Gammaproteobacteria bacterium]